MNLKTLRSLFNRLSRDAVRVGPSGVLALANTGTTQSHAHELIEAKRLALAEENRPRNAVFWHRQSHARAFDADGELVQPLYLHWIGDRVLIASALANLLEGADVRLVPADRDEVAFVIEPLAASPGSSPSKPAKAKPAKGKPAKATSESAKPERFLVTQLKDTPETETLLIDAVRTRDGASALDALQALVRFSQVREDKLVARHRKAGTLDAFYAELASKPGPYPPQVIDALAENVARVAEAVTEMRESAFSLALHQARRAAHPALADMLDVTAAAPSWRARRVVAQQCARDTAGSEIVLPRLEKLALDPELNVVSEAARSLAKVRGDSLPKVWLDLLDAGRLAPPVRSYALRDLVYSELGEAERVRARRYVSDPDLRPDDADVLRAKLA